MITEHKVLQLPSNDGDSMDVEVNWSDHEMIKDCQMLKFRIRDQEIEIKRDDLMDAIMTIGKVSDIKRALPMKLGNVKKLERMLTFQFKCSKDIKAGEIVTVQAPWIDKLEVSEEVFAGNLKARENPLNKFLK